MMGFSEKQDNWHRRYLRIANEYAAESKDPKFKVGALIVTPDDVLYPGYNGDERGGSNTRDSMDTGGSGFIHGEINALIKFNPSLHKGSVMYITYNPCIVCARAIINTRSIDAVFYDKEYSGDMRGVDLLRKRGIVCRRLEVSEDA